MHIRPHRYTFDVIGEIFFGRMLGFLRNSEDYGAYIASLDALMHFLCTIAFLCTVAIALRHLRPVIDALMAIIPTVVATAKSLDSIRTAALAAVGSRMKSI
jgi:hypothetical protein